MLSGNRPTPNDWQVPGCGQNQNGPTRIDGHFLRNVEHVRIVPVAMALRDDDEITGSGVLEQAFAVASPVRLNESPFRHDRQPLDCSFERLMGTLCFLAIGGKELPDERLGEGQRDWWLWDMRQQAQRGQMRLKPLGKIGPYADKPPDTALIIDVHQDGLVHGRGVPPMLSVRHCERLPLNTQAWDGSSINYNGTFPRSRWRATH